MGAVTRFMMEFNATHPKKKAKLVDYGIVVLMLPCIMLGSFLGVQINVVVPPVLILCMLGFVLLYVSYRSSMKGYSMYKEEQMMLHNRMNPLGEISFSESSKSFNDSNSEEAQQVKVLNNLTKYLCFRQILMLRR